MAQRNPIRQFVRWQSAAQAHRAQEAHAAMSTQVETRPYAEAAERVASLKTRYRYPVNIAPVPDEGGYQVMLGHVPLKTPAKNPLVLPTRLLAIAVAAEWECQERGKLKPHTMPLMSLTATAIDQPKPWPKVIDNLLKYVHTDAACIRYERGALQRRQAETFDPLLHWAQEQMGWKLHTCDSIFGTTQDSATVEAALSYMKGLSPWQLAVLDDVTSASKSLLVAAALVAGRLSVAQALAAARLEEDFQMEEWGCVEAGHDLDIADAKTRITAAATFVRLLAAQQ